MPDDSIAPLLDAIRNAQRRVLVEMYMLTSVDALEALQAAHGRGVDVRVLLELSPYGDPLANQPAFSILATAGIDVRWIQRARGLVHAKFVVVDSAIAYVLTLNLTTSGLGRNREYAVADPDPVDIRWAETVWNADAVGAEPGASPRGSRLVVSPGDARTRLTALVDSAVNAIMVEIEEISDFELVDRLGAAASRGVEVTVIAPGANRSGATTAALGRLAAAAAQVRVLDAPVVHAKAMIVDGRRAYVGSINFTRASLDDNREVGIVLEEAKVVGRLSARMAEDAAKAVAFP